MRCIGLGALVQLATGQPAALAAGELACRQSAGPTGELACTPKSSQVCRRASTRESAGRRPNRPANGPSFAAKPRHRSRSAKKPTSAIAFVRNGNRAARQPSQPGPLGLGLLVRVGQERRQPDRGVGEPKFTAPGRV